MLRALLAVALLLPVLANAECNCAGIGACLKVKMRLALQNLQSLNLEDIPEETLGNGSYPDNRDYFLCRCRQKAKPEKLVELKEKMQKCQPKDEEVPEDIKNIITQKITCAQEAVIAGCQKPDPFASRIFDMLSSSGSLPMPGCESPETLGANLPPPIRARITAQLGGKCTLKAKIDDLKNSVKAKYPELGETLECLHKHKCSDMGTKLGEVKAECVEGNGCDGSNFVSGIINIKKTCLKDGVGEKVKEKYTEVCNCVADQLEFTDDVRADVCAFPEECVQV